MHIAVVISLCVVGALVVVGIGIGLYFLIPYCYALRTKEDTDFQAEPTWADVPPRFWTQPPPQPSPNCPPFTIHDLQERTYDISRDEVVLRLEGTDDLPRSVFLPKTVGNAGSRLSSDSLVTDRAETFDVESGSSRTSLAVKKPKFSTETESHPQPSPTHRPYTIYNPQDRMYEEEGLTPSYADVLRFERIENLAYQLKAAAGNAETQNDQLITKRAKTFDEPSGPSRPIPFPTSKRPKLSTETEFSRAEFPPLTVQTKTARRIISMKSSLTPPKNVGRKPIQQQSHSFPGKTEINVVVNEQEEYRERVAQKLVQFRILQKQLLERIYMKPKCPLLICVDARPTQIGGYCVNFMQRICSYYTFNTKVLPWDLQDKSMKGDPAEFEMKNLMFALLLWEREIKTFGQVEIHTDNSAIKHLTSEYGVRAYNFIQHFKTCEGVSMNQDFHLSSEREPEAFAKFIVPADDLSRWRLEECEDFLRAFYRMDMFQKTHVLQTNVGRPSAKPSYRPTSHYQEYIDKVEKSIKRWIRNPCLDCGFMVEDTISLHDFG